MVKIDFVIKKVILLTKFDIRLKSRKVLGWRQKAKIEKLSGTMEP